MKALYDHTWVFDQLLKCHIWHCQEYLQILEKYFLVLAHAYEHMH